MQLGAFIITFNRPHILKQTIDCLLQQSRPPDFILVVDNGQAQETVKVLRQFPAARIGHHPLGDNLGPAAAEAFGLQWLSEQGYDWLYWVDDDNPPQTPDTLERLLHLAARVEPQADVAGLAAVGQSFDWVRGEIRRLPDDRLTGPVEVDVIGGNCQFILRRAAVQVVGLPDRRLFIDFEDTEYCLRLRQAGYRLLVDGELMWTYRHKAGRLNLKPARLPLQRRHYAREQYQNLWRRYYSTRNYIFVMRRTFQRPDLARREALKALGRAGLAWRRGPRYGLAYSRLQLQAILDGYRDRLGRTVLPQPKHT